MEYAFTKCTLCEETRSAIGHGTKQGMNLELIKRQRKDHIKFVNCERLVYKKKRDRAILQPDQKLSIIVDADDKSRHGLPSVNISTKGQRGNALKVRLIGILEHCDSKRLHLYTLSGEFESGEYHVVGCIHCFITERAKQCPLSWTVFSN